MAYLLGRPFPRPIKAGSRQRIRLKIVSNEGDGLEGQTAPWSDQSFGLMDLFLRDMIHFGWTCKSFLVSREDGNEP